MNKEFGFFITNMPKSRKADFYLGCLDGSIFIDFNKSIDNRINLCRISFDGFGCCNLGYKAKSLNYQSSKVFIEEISKEHLDQEKIKKLVFELIRLNKDFIWEDAIEEYQLKDME